MGFTRKWDSSCPRVWDSWEVDGAKWIIQDLPPEDEDAALDILINSLLKDEILCRMSNILGDPVSLKCITEIWRACMSQRMCLACYNEVDGKKTLVGVNVCFVESAEERFPTIEIEGDAWINVYKATGYIETKCDPFKYLGGTRLLHALGLIVKDDYRGHKLGTRILAAREPLALSQGINATATVFTGPASQMSAERCGFETICVVSLKELADQGLNYPSDENWIMGFTRKWDSSCPRIWDSWEVDGAKWIIQDLPPEDEDAALDILIKYFLKDEILCRMSNVLEDPVSLKCITEIWQACMSQRMCLACYNEIDGKKTLVGVNVCIVESAEERFPTIEIEGDAWINVYKAMEYIETKCDPFKYLGGTKLLHSQGQSDHHEHSSNEEP